MPAAGVPYSETDHSGSPDPKSVPDCACAGAPRCRRDRKEQHDELQPVTAGDDVVSAVQIVVSYLWNTESERRGSGPAGHIMQQLRTLTRWLTTLPRD